VEVIVHYDRASAGLLQRRLSIGYARAARLIDQLEAAGVLAPMDGSKPREVLIHSAEEVLDNSKKQSNQHEDDPFEAPKNYKTPSDVPLSKGKNIPWGKHFSDVFGTKDLKDSKIKFPLPLGFDDKGNLRMESLLEVNNLIIAGNTLSQKENLVDTFLLNFILRYAPTQLRFILSDPTHYLDLYNGTPHLLSPVISTHDKIISALKWSQYEMERRLKHFSEAGVRDIRGWSATRGSEELPHILIISFVDFFGVETEDAMIRLTAQGARTGIHSMIVVDRTDRTSLPGLIKTNIPARAVFRLTSTGESRAIDAPGGEKLEPGELIYKPNYGNAVKLKAIFTPEANVKEVVEAAKT
jgi:DNA segregation ATPase FtsK/SpoIIIE, S-DNA-T family